LLSQVSESEPQLSPPGPHWQWASVQLIEVGAAGDSLAESAAARGARPAGGPGPGPPRQAAVPQCRCCEGHAWVAAAGGGDQPKTRRARAPSPSQPACATVPRRKPLAAYAPSGSRPRVGTHASSTHRPASRAYAARLRVLRRASRRSASRRSASRPRHAALRLSVADRSHPPLQVASAASVR
jgi:hypothetical protein